MAFVNTTIAQDFDWQGHRGCRGLLPENTVPAFLHALEYAPVRTLELDLAVSKDHELIVSHEPWMSEHICTKPDGSPVTKAEAMTLRIYGMSSGEVKQYDCGQRGNHRFPQQRPQPAQKPSLEEVVQAVRKFCEEQKRPMPRFNLEIKSHPQGDSIFTPPVEDFAKLVVAELKRLKISELSCVQSFDVRALQWVKRLAPELTLAYLVENKDSWEINFERLGFRPDIYSPDFKLLRKKDVRALHQLGIRVVPWTVNNVREMKRLRRWGVDGIITDYPNMIEAVF